MSEEKEEKVDNIIDSNFEENEIVESEKSEIEVEEVKTEESEIDELAEAKNKYLRLYADFENFRKRTAKEKIDTIINATQDLIKDLLPILDDFERAQKSMENSDDVQAVKDGILLIYNKLNNTLSSKGLKPIIAGGEKFDVELHDCITQFEAGEDKKGMVIDEVEKGYYLNDKVLRHAKVVVGS